MGSKGSAHTVRVSSDTHQKLRTLAYMNNTSMTEMITLVVDAYLERGMTSQEQGAMWKIMSAQVTLAREKKE